MTLTESTVKRLGRDASLVQERWDGSTVASHLQTLPLHFQIKLSEPALIVLLNILHLAARISRKDNMVSCFLPT